MTKQTKIMIVAGEASGDRHAAKLINAMRAVDNGRELEFFGAAGPAMRDSGVEAVVASDELSVVGLLEIGSALPMFLAAFKRLTSAARDRRPDVAILVDFPDFNLKIARSLKKQGITVVYYISPQLWAWRKYRLSTIKNYVDLVITILPFEKAWYAEHGYDKVVYVGSPLAMEVHADQSRDYFRTHHGIDIERPLVALLPGSRHKEIFRILPEMLKSVDILKRRNADMQFVVAVANEKNLADCNAILEGFGRLKPTIVTGDTYNALNAADAAVITSGTATLEAGIIGTPMAVIYKTSNLNYRLFEPIIDVPHYGLINLIAEKRVARELIQHDCTPESIADEVERLLDPGVNARVRNELAIAVDKLGHGGASKRAAEAIFKLIG